MKKQLIGAIISDKMSLTAVVETEEIKENSKYRRKFSFSKKYKAHNENNQFKTGDKVMIEECRPISKDKKWRIVKILNSKS